MENNNVIVPENEQTTIMTDEQLEAVANTLEENLSDDDKFIRDLIDNEITPNEEIEAEIINVNADPDSGELRFEDADPYKNTDLPIGEIVDGGLDEKNQNAAEEAVQNSTENYNLSDDEGKQLLEVLMKYRTGENFNIYEELPDPIKKYVDEFVAAGAQQGKQVTRNQVAKFFLDEFIRDAEINREFVDFQTAIEKELQIPSISDMYSEHIKEIMEVKLIESADKLEEEYPDRAKALRDISAMFTDSYTFGLMKSTLINNKKARNKIRESVGEYNKYCNAFNLRNKNIVVKINDVFMVAKTLNRILPEEIGLDDIKKFVVLFCKTCEQLDVHNTVHCAYMYYTIKNILALDHVNESMTDFSKDLVANIISTINFINETQSQIEASMPEKLLKKKIKKCNKN